MLDLLLAHATVVDGTGAPGFAGSVGIAGDRIVSIARNDAAEQEAVVVIDAGGAVVCPGFVDVHNHADVGAIVDPWFPNLLRQGITTVVAGNCGSSPWPIAGADDSADLVGLDPGELEVEWSSFGGYLDAVARRRPAINLASLVGHGAVRMQVLGLEPRPPDAHELDTMRGLVADAMSDGAVGMSTGLIYTPGMFADTEEIVALAGEAARAGGVYTSHIRGEGEPLFDAVAEAIEIGSRAGLPVHVSHLKCETSFVHGRAGDLLALLHGSGNATGDQYPYTAWNSGLSSLLPPWAPLARVGEIARTERDRLRHAVEEGEPGFQSSVRGVGWGAIVIEETADRSSIGRSLAAVAEARDIEPFDAMIRLLEEAPTTLCVGHAMHEDDVETIAADPAVFVATDASVASPEGPRGASKVHPREYGTFPRVLARYVRERGVLSLEAAVAKMTSLPAERFGLRDRGRIEEGSFADLVVFDPTTVGDAATFDTPHVYPEGIERVIVNGVVVWDGVGYGERAGRVLRRA